MKAIGEQCHRLNQMEKHFSKSDRGKIYFFHDKGRKNSLEREGGVELGDISLLSGGRGEGGGGHITMRVQVILYTHEVAVLITFHIPETGFTRQI
jgi:hypothetical protein